MYPRRPWRDRAADFVITTARVMRVAVEGARKAVLVDLRGVETGEDEKENLSETSESEPLYGALGVVATPRRAVRREKATGLDPEGYTEVVAARLGDSVQPIAARDLRLNEKVTPAEGRMYFVQYGGGFLSLEDASDGRGTSVTLYAPHLNADGSTEKAGAIAIDPAQGTIALVQQDGAAFTLSPDGAITRSKTGAAFTALTEEEFKVSAPRTFVYTGSFLLYVPNSSNTAAHAISVDEADGSISIVCRDGSAFMMKDGATTIKSPLGTAFITVRDGEVAINGTLKVNGSVHLGVGVGGLQIAPTLEAIPPVPVPTNAILHGLFGNAGVASAIAFVHA